MSTASTTDARLTTGADVAVVAVGVHGSAEDRVLVDRAIGAAAGHGARLLVVAPYEPTSPRVLARAHRDAPADVLADINPVFEVETLLHRHATRAVARGLGVTTIAVPGRGSRAVLRAAEAHGADLLVGAPAGTQPRVRAAFASLRGLRRGAPTPEAGRGRGSEAGGSPGAARERPGTDDRTRRRAAPGSPRS